jgi:hypothetical protein
MTLSDAAVDVHPTALPPRIVIAYCVAPNPNLCSTARPSGGLQVADPPRVCLVGWGWPASETTGTGILLSRDLVYNIAARGPNGPRYVS